MSQGSALRRTLVSLICCLAAQAVFAQGVASLSGTVREANGEPLPGATIVLANAKGVAVKSAQTDAQGGYRLGDVKPGAYRVSASLAGYVTGKADVTVAEGEAATRDFALEVSFFENVTVTPQKREQEILDVPASITAVTGATVEKQGFTNIKDIQATIPSLSVVEQAPGAQHIQIRGISSAQNLPTVGVYVDEASVNIDSAQSGVDVSMLDLDRVEVLRGPQGTLYGEGSMGGTIKYVTKDPNPNRSGFHFDAQAGTVTDGGTTYRGTLIANLPVVANKFAIRLLAATEHQPGWVDYSSTGEEDVNSGDSQTYRAKALWVASDTFNATLMLQHQKNDFEGKNWANADRTAPDFVLDQPELTKSTLTNLVLNWNLGSVALLSSTGYLDRDNEGVYDFTSVYAPFLPPGYAVPYSVNGNVKVFTEELRLSGAGNGRFHWTAGAYFRDLSSSGDQLIQTIPSLGFDLLNTSTTADSTQLAFFGEGEYAFTPKFSATLGLRYFRDERKQSASTPGAEPVNQDATFDTVNPRFVATFRPADGRLFYASVAKGFRSGGFNPLIPGCTLPNSYEPETLWTYEVGSSASLSGGRVVVQGALYHNRWSDIQTLTICPPGFAFSTNTGKASGTGADLQLTLAPSRSLRLSLTGNYNDSQYDTAAAAHDEGDPIDYVPDYTLGVSADWTFRWSSKVPGLLHADYQKTDSFLITLRNVVPEPLSSDAISGLSARLSATVGRVDLFVYGQNLLDEDGALYPACVPCGLPSPVSAQPRTIGVGFGFDY